MSDIDILNFQLKRLLAAMEKEEGIKPAGSVQHELRGLLNTLADVASNHEAKLKELRGMIEKSSQAKIIEKLDQLILRQEGSWFGRIFGRLR